RMARKQRVSVKAAGMRSIPGLLEFIAMQPPDVFGLRGGSLPQRIPKARHLRQPRKVPILAEDIGRLVVMVVHIILGLRFAPSEVVSFEFPSLSDRKRRNAHARQAEMIGAVVMPRLGMRVRTNRQSKFPSDFLDGRIKRRALGTADFDLFGNPKGRKRVVVQI